MGLLMGESRSLRLTQTVHPHVFDDVQRLGVLVDELLQELRDLSFQVIGLVLSYILILEAVDGSV